MILNSFKDLKKGDKVRFKEDFNPTGKPEEGEGTVYGFGEFALKVFVWIQMGDGELKEIAYEYVKKI